MMDMWVGLGFDGGHGTMRLGLVSKMPHCALFSVKNMILPAST